MTYTTGRLLGTLAIAATVIGTTACDAVLGVDADANANVAFEVQRVNTSLLGLGSSAPNEMTADGHTLVVTGAAITASELELKGFSSGSGTSGSGSSGSETISKFEIGPVTVELPVTGGTSREIPARIAAGTYDKFEMDVRTVRVRGTYDGAPFDVTIAVNDELELRLIPALVVTDGSSDTAVKVALDLQSWFRSSTGGVLDPRLAQSDTTVAARLRSNISGSFEAFDDHGGDDDDR
jgi:hypothetical protein